jgi:hypothetical protein
MANTHAGIRQIIFFKFQIGHNFSILKTFTEAEKANSYIAPQGGSL